MTTDFPSAKRLAASPISQSLCCREQRRTLLYTHCMEGGNREELVWEGGVGVSSKRSISSSTSLLIPEDGQLGSTGMGRGRESPSAFVNSFQGQKTSQAQTLNYPLQAPLAAAAAIHSPLRSARTDCRTAWRRWKGVPHPPPRPATSGERQSQMGKRAAWGRGPG